MCHDDATALTSVFPACGLFAHLRHLKKKISKTTEKTGHLGITLHFLGDLGGSWPMFHSHACWKAVSCLSPHHGIAVLGSTGTHPQAQGTLSAGHSAACPGRVLAKSALRFKKKKKNWKCVLLGHGEWMCQWSANVCSQTH